mmetsp:Transcript_83824/g.215795  ORF Transcript_83824/g.215795 Transcript_83824/m.215795 type:complete len:80 (+) Transcript_83824:374-613(+)
MLRHIAVRHYEQDVASAQTKVAARRRAPLAVEPISPTAMFVNLTAASGYDDLRNLGVLDSPPGHGPRATPGFESGSFVG